MNFLAETQMDSRQSPEMVVHVGDFEAKVALENILLELAAHGKDIGYDDPRLIPETEPDSVITALESQLFNKDDEPVTLEGQIGEAVLEAVQAAADSEEMKCQNAARFMLGMELVKDEAAPSVVVDAPFEKVLPILHIAKKQPEHTDARGTEVPYSSHVEIRNPAELYAAARAVNAVFNQDTQKKDGLPDLDAALEQTPTEEEPIVFDGNEARVIYGALNLMAHGLSKNTNDTPVNDYDKENARYVLRTWKGENYVPTEAPPIPYHHDI